DRVRQAEVHHGLCQTLDDLSRRDVESGNIIIKAGDWRRAFLPHLNAARIDQLNRIRLRRPEQPSRERLELLRLLRGNLLEGVMIVAHQHEEALVNDGRVVKLFMRMASTERRNGGIESGG